MKTITTRPDFFWRKLLGAMLTLGAVSFLQGCGGSSSTASGNEATANDVFYAGLAANNYLSHPSAQPPVDPFVSVKHFDLTPDTEATNSLRATQTAAAPYVVYQPAHIRAARSNLAAATSEIPGFKSQKAIPLACMDLADEELKTCLEDNAPQTTTGQAGPYMSHFDAAALKALLGNGFDTVLVNKAIDSNLSHISSTDRQRALAQLADYINDAEAHQKLDLTTHNVFERSGYVLDGVTFTDTSRGDIDGDGNLDNHSTMIIQVSKKLSYVRSGQSVLDAVLRKAYGQLPVETYVVKLNVFVHLKDLSGLRQRVAEPVNFLTAAEESSYMNQKAKADWINYALDANILRNIAQSPNLIPWTSTEYALSFQVSPDNITQHLAPAMEASLAVGDQATVDTLSQHINAQTLLMTGTAAALPQGAQTTANPVKTFYQVTRSRTGLAANSWTGSDAEYGMFDAAGNRVALLDPKNGALMLAGESPTSLSRTPVSQKFTKPGACQGDRSHWAYWPSQVRTSRFGRGIQWILTEWIFHNQVGDYKNIHWYNSAWKAAAQVAIKGGMKAVEYYLNGEVAVPVGEGSAAVVEAFEVAVPSIGRALSVGGKGEHGKSFSIAGYNFSVPDSVVTITKQTAETTKNNQTFREKLTEKVSKAVKSFLIGRFTDGIGQSLDVTVTGWQDYSDSSHYGCFQFD